MVRCVGRYEAGRVVCVDLPQALTRLVGAFAYIVGRAAGLEGWRLWMLAYGAPLAGLAVLYAQHWAESDGKPDLAAARRPEKVEAVEVILRMIRTAILMGNTVDAWLARVLSCFRSVA